MKIEKLNDDSLIVFLNKFYIEKNNFSLKNNLENYFKKIFKILNDCYSIEIIGYYNIRIYRDKIYGYVLEMNKEDLDFYNYYDTHIDMKITISNFDRFVFKLNSNSLLEKRLLNFCYLIKYDKDIYLIPKKTITQYYLGNLIENCKIIYGSKAREILENSERINSKYIFV